MYKPPLAKRLPLIALGCIVLLCSSNLFAQKKLTVLSNTWAPYINPQQSQAGTAAAILNLLATEMNSQLEWQYVPYDLSFQLVKRDRAGLAYPFFKTPERAQEVIFSEPVFSASSHLYYNLQHLSQEQSQAELATLRIGRVSGYSYGQTIDKLLNKATTYSNERAALQALFNHQIDLLPMTDGVMAHTLRSEFPERIQLIRQRPGISDQSSLHIIAPNTPQGKQTITAFNQALNTLRNLHIDSMNVTPNQLPPPLDLAQLKTAEGYPAILGQSQRSPGGEFYTLPQGSKVIVLEWSDKITHPSSTDRIYKNMMDLSRVVILNGPHVGKELYIRNMHIELL